MSNYRTHVTFNLLFGLPLVASGAYYFYEPPIYFFLTFILSFCFATCYMNPDLDLIHLIKPFSLRGILTLPFRFYSRFFKHRGLSHSIWFGTATRVIWLFGVALLIFYLVYQTIPSEKTFLFYLNSYKLYLIYALAGIVLADFFHLVLDYRKIFK